MATEDCSFCTASRITAFQYQLCKDTELANKTLVFRNDKSLNEFLEKAFIWFQEVNTLENMMGK